MMFLQKGFALVCHKIFSSTYIQYQNTLMLDKVYGVDFPYPTVFRKMENHEIHIFVPNSMLNLSNRSHTILNH